MNKYGLVDFHCHLDLYPDHVAIVNECEQAGIFTLAVTTTPKAWPSNFALTRSTKYVRAALGLHPQLVAERSGELGLWKEYLPQARYIGEVGLDAGQQFYSSLDKQKEVFRTVLDACARAGGKILSVHSVRATKVVLDMIQDHLPSDRGQVVLHWFSGSQADIKRAYEHGCYFSVNEAMLSNDRLRKLMSVMPLDRILTETDGPFTKCLNRASKPSDIGTTIEFLAKLKGLNANIVAESILQNLRRITLET